MPVAHFDGLHVRLYTHRLLELTDTVSETCIVGMMLHCETTRRFFTLVSSTSIADCFKDQIWVCFLASQELLICRSI
jgi:hypothetical protein